VNRPPNVPTLVGGVVVKIGAWDLGPGSDTFLRETLGLPSCDGVRPLGKKPT
jgi:hypothetical protein